MSTRIGAKTRAIAIDALGHILTRHMHADSALDKLFQAQPDLKALDKAFIFEMVYGSLRWLSKMDWILSHMMDRPFSSLDVRVANALRVGTYQIFYMDRVPDRAAVSETVEAVKQVGAHNATSFVNAILRRIARKAEYFPKPDKEKNPVEYLAMQYAHPQWMVERWFKYVPFDRLEHLLEANNTQPAQNVRVIKRNQSEEIHTYLLRTFGIESSFRPLKGVLGLQKLPPLGSCEAFQRGEYMVQDEAAQLVASLVQPGPEDTVLDACAAPGGKTIYLWDEGMEPKNLAVSDFSQKRIAILSENFNRVRLEGIEIIHGDAAEVLKKRQFNKVLLDAPCSSMGVIRRHPEIKWHRTPADIEQCAREQYRLLSSLCQNVGTGGELIYAVCSFESEETSEITQKFLAENKEFNIVPLSGRIHDYYRRYLTAQGELLLLPGNPDHLDGFYAVIFKKG